MKENFSTAETQEERLPVFLAKLGDLSLCFLNPTGYRYQVPNCVSTHKTVVFRISQTTTIEDELFQVNMFEYVSKYS